MKKVYRTLSVRRPFADEIAAGEKRIENRDWGEGITGNIALHACGPDGGYIMGIMHVREVIGWEEAWDKYPSQQESVMGGAECCWPDFPYSTPFSTFFRRAAVEFPRKFACPAYRKPPKRRVV